MNLVRVAVIQYDFAKFAVDSENAPSSNEEILTEKLVNKISLDYKTKNIVVAVDAIENISNVTNQKEFTGVGEVRIGSLVWNKIKFDAVMDDANKTAAKIVL